MEKAQRVERPPNPRKNANIFSVLTFAYTLPTFIKGYRKELDEEDMTEHLDAHASKKLGDRLEAAWRKELQHHKKPSLLRATARVFWPEFFFLGFVAVFEELVIKLSQPLALSQLMKYYTQTDNHVSTTEAYIYSGAIVGASFCLVLISHNYMLSLQHFGMKMRVACCSLIYRKSLRLRKTALEGTAVGQVVNLLANDVNRCDRAMLHLHMLWLCPLEATIIVAILYYMVGFTSTVGVLFMVMFVPLQMYLGKRTAVLRLRTAIKSDERIRLMNEIINGIQVIKMYTWEKPFAKLVALVRRLEIRQIRAKSYIRSVMFSCIKFITKFAVFVTILTYVLLGNVPNAEYVYVVTAFYGVLRQSLTKNFSRGIMEVAELKVAFSRIQTFLLRGEIANEEENRNSYYSSNMVHTTKTNDTIKSHTNLQHNLTEAAVDVNVRLSNATTRWYSDSPDNTLNDVNFHAQRGQLVAIIGPVGSGKTSLLHVILKELPLTAGTLAIEGTISYASQEPWVFSGTIQQNILFGQSMKTERYQKVLKVCALEHDLHLFPYGDQTLVGERGVMLSGGQKARVNLARAIYKEADIYLLDDPLSAVDTHVGKQLFDECIVEFLGHTCTILVTHQLQYLQNADRIFVIENGRTTVSGTYEDLRQSGIDFTKQLGGSDNEEKVIDEKGREVVKKEELKKTDGPTQHKERKATGRIQNDVYMSYFKAGGSLVTVFVIGFMFIAEQVAFSSSDYFLSYWVNTEQAKSEDNATNASDTGSQGLSRDTSISIYSGIIVCLIVLMLGATFSFFRYSMKASKRLHDNAFSNIVYAPMRFFNTNPSGRILNRFAKDIGSIDETLPMAVLDCINTALSVIGVTVVVSLVKPWLLIVTGVILTVFYLLRVVYLATSRSVKRLDGVTRSPVFAHLSASLQGLTTIRAYGAQRILEKEFDNLQDMHSSTWYLFLTCTRGFGFLLDTICVLYIGAVTFSFFLSETDEYGGNVGLAITQAMSLTGLFQWGMRQWSELENQMTSVERVVEYSKLDREPERKEKIPSASWPEEGSIDFLSVSLRYSPEDPYVLRQLNFSINSKEKIGIVGRTGAGKSSLIYALFQLTATEGAILIDDIDITKIPLDSLRSKISIIPQDPVLFSGTLRKNLDPFDEHSDEKLWSALEEVELKDAVADIPAGLNVRMSEGGSNFSVGQRQLVCLARAIIRKNRILMLDEATANVDPQTDAFIQDTIRRKFADCTVLTVAHRLHTIMDSDKVLVMDDGKAVEFDHPHLLLNNKDSLFFSMVQQTGPGVAEILSKIAENTFKGTVKNN